jgi:SAM-dependent methyltransferase
MSERPGKPDQEIQRTVAQYYTDKLRTFGATPRGVDWNSADSQSLRFRLLLNVLEDVPGASLNDYGCGYGALADCLVATGRQLLYRGFDISDAMVSAARGRHVGEAWCSFTSDPGRLQPADYTVASGIFNVKLDHSVDSWREYVMQTLVTLDALSERGFAFNALSTYSDPDKRRGDLFYADPLEFFNWCKTRGSRGVSLLHDYPLYEFTMIVRK